MSERVIIHSDGGADPNPGVGGWAALIRDGAQETILTGSAPHTTNNRMELEAAVAALSFLDRPRVVDFYTDSEYVRRGMAEHVAGWAASDWKTKSGRAVANAELWQKLHELALKHQITWYRVRGHSGDPDNDRVDALARQARLSITPEIVPETGLPKLYLSAIVHGNPGPGAWGAALEEGGFSEALGGAQASTTNNRMELLAAIEGLRLLKAGSGVQVLTASDYVFQGITRWMPDWRERGWRKKDGGPVANADLWQALSEATGHYDVQWVNVKGQRLAGLDRAAAAAAEALRLSRVSTHV